MRFVLGWGLKPKLDDGLEARPKGYREDPKNSLYFMPWALDEIDKDYGMAQKTLPTIDMTAQ